MRRRKATAHDPDFITILRHEGAIRHIVSVAVGNVSPRSFFLAIFARTMIFNRRAANEYSVVEAARS
jgi:hypothetical protein